MRVVSSIDDVRNAVGEARRAGARVGFVPTMGALHDGHLSLVTRSRSLCDVTVMSIYVNPLQFGPNEDLSRYPRPVEDDERLATDAGVDILFRPDDETMYPPGRTIGVTAGKLGAELEGASRPGHFDGMLTVVAKLFNIVEPDIAVFGQKDLQQAALVRALVRDLDMQVEIVVAPIVREADGIAMSSRNRYLSEGDRVKATVLSRALRAVKQEFDRGERSVAKLEFAGREVLAGEPEVKADYIRVVNRDNFRSPEEADDRSSVVIAARVGSTRLIDNMSLSTNDQD
jgi:pantoate--beta-alanine ligase